MFASKILVHYKSSIHENYLPDSKYADPYLSGLKTFPDCPSIEEGNTTPLHQEIAQ